MAQAVQAGQTAAGTGLIISSSRAILYASAGADFAGAARRATQALRETNQRRSPPTARDELPRGRTRRPRCAGACLAAARAPTNDVSSVAVPPGAAILLRGNGPEPDSLDPQKARGFEAQTVLRDLCEGLTTLDKHAARRAGRGAQTGA